MTETKFHELRNGCFTSSKCHLLIPYGKRPMTEAELEASKLINPKSRVTTISDGFTPAGISYIEEKIYERRHGGSLDSNNDSFSTQWGLLCEKYVFSILPTHYELMGDMPKIHPDTDYWRGSPDAINHQIKSVVEIKCPYTRLSFSKLVEPLYRGMDGMDAMNFIRENHSEGEAYYWQIVSNAILTGMNKGELIVFMPKKNDIEEIRDMLYVMKDDEQRKYYRFVMLENERFPHLNDNSEYKSLNRIVFDVSEEDKILLTSRISDAHSELIKLLQVSYEESC